MSMAEKQIPWYFTPAVVIVTGCLVAMVNFGVAMSSFGIVMAALGRIVPPEKRSWAFGIATASGSLGQFIFAPSAAL